MTVREEVRQIEVIPLDNIRAKQGGDRCKDVESLANSIKAIGLISPIVVRRGQGPTYDIVAGHRRFAAAKVAGLDNIRAIVIDADDNLTEIVRMSENVHRLQMSPFEEAEAIVKLRKLKRTTEEIAADLGMRPQFVARRERLTTVIPEWVKRAQASEKGDKGISIAALEIIATFDHDMQKNLLKKYLYWSPDVSRLKDDLAGMTNRLKAAPWDLNDSLLVPEAGACSSCPKRSSCQPLLFHDEVDAKKISANERCLDEKCWNRKKEANFQKALDAAVEEHGDLIYVEAKGDYGATVAGFKNKEVLHSHKYEFAKKGASGSKPAMIVNGEKAGTVIHIRVKKEYSQSKQAKAATQGGPKKLNSEQDRKARRAKMIINEIRKIQDKVPTGLTAQTPQMQILMLASVLLNCKRYLDKKHWESLREFKKLNANDAIKELWKLVLREVHIPVNSFADALGFIKPVRSYAEVVLALNWNDLEAKALKAIPDPKPKAGATPKKKAGKK